MISTNTDILYMLVVNKYAHSCPNVFPNKHVPPSVQVKIDYIRKKHVLSNHTLNGPFVRFYDPHHPRHVNDGLLTMMVLLYHITIYYNPIKLGKIP